MNEKVKLPRIFESMTIWMNVSQEKRDSDLAGLGAWLMGSPDPKHVLGLMGLTAAMIRSLDHDERPSAGDQTLVLETIVLILRGWHMEHEAMLNKLLLKAIYAERSWWTKVWERVVYGTPMK